MTPSSNTSTCVICLDPFRSPSSCQPCGHVFCHDCITKWYSSNKHCPQCRHFICDIVEVEPVSVMNRMVKFWMNLHPVFRIILILCVLSFLVYQELGNPDGIFQALVIPLLRHLYTLLVEFFNIVVLVISRLAVGIWHGTVDFAVGFWDVLVDVGYSLKTICYILLEILLVVYDAVFKWVKGLAILISNIFWSVVLLATCLSIVSAPELFS